MAACGAMYLKIGVLVTALMLLVAGCTKMVDGRGVIAVPPPGSPIEWRLCQADPSDESRVPSERRVRDAVGACGLCQARRRRRAACDDPVQGHRREDRVAVHQPRWTGGVGRGGRGIAGLGAAAVGARAVRSHRLRPARRRELHAGGVVQLRRRQRSAAGRPPGRLHAGGRRAHRGRDQGLRPALRRQDGRGVPGQRRNRQRRQGSRRDAHRGRRRQADVPGLLVRHPDRVVIRGGPSGQGAGDDPRRGRRPQRRPDRGQHPSGQSVPDRVQRLRRRLCGHRRSVPAGHRSRQGGRRLPQHGRAAGGERR